MTLNLSSAADFALECARAAAALGVEQFGLVTARRKFDGSLVTEVDEAADRLIAARIAATYPSHGILSEEQTTTYDPAYEYTWVVDPIDGTTNYARGLPIWGVSIGLLWRGEPVVGVLVFPLLHEEFCAIKDFGATRNGARIHTASRVPTDDKQLILTCTRTPRRYRLDSPLKQRILGSAAYHLAKVADGTALAGIEASPKLWDLAAAAVLLREAGALLEPLSGPTRLPVAAEHQEYRSLSMPVVAAANPATLAHVRVGLEERA